MKKDKFNLYSAFVILAFSFIIACANTPNLVGKWKEIGKAATLELDHIVELEADNPGFNDG